MKRNILHLFLVAAIFMAFAMPAFSKQQETTSTEQSGKAAKPMTYYVTATQLHSNCVPNAKAVINISESMVLASGMSDKVYSKIHGMQFRDLTDAAAFLSYAGWELEQCYAIPAGIKSQVTWVFSKTVTDTSELLSGFPKK